MTYRHPRENGGSLGTCEIPACAGMTNLLIKVLRL